MYIIHKMLRLVCILLVFLTHQAHGGSLTTEEHSDLAATAIQSNKLLTRIIKYVNIEYPIALVVGRVWSKCQTVRCSSIYPSHRQSTSGTTFKSGRLPTVS